MNINATLFGQALWFAVFIWLTMKYIWPPLQKAMHERQQQIADRLVGRVRQRAGHHLLVDQIVSLDVLALEDQPPSLG